MGCCVMQRIIAWLESALSHRLAGAVLLGLVAIGYAIAYRMHPLFPGNDPGAIARGWWTWTDQSRYLAEAAAISEGRLDATTYHYPVGYPAVGALFWRWMPVNPFFMPNLLLVVGAAAMWWRLAVRWLSRVEALLAAILFVGTHRWLIATTMIVPWNTIATQALLLAGIWIVVTRKSLRAVWVLGGLAALAYAVRPIDAVAFGPLLVFATLRLATWRARVLHGAGAAVVIALMVVAIGWLNLRVFGQWRSPYETISTQTIGFFSYPISFKFYWLFVDGGPLFRETDPALLWRYPWLAFAIAGAAFWVKRERWAGAAGLAALGLNWLLYVNYNDLLPSDIYRFTLIHYLAWGFPLLFLLVAAACRHGWGTRWGQVGIAMSLVVWGGALGVRLEERPVLVEQGASESWRLPAERPLLVRFPSASIERVGDLRLEGRALVEYSDYLVPYVPSELQLLLGTRTAGTRLTVAPESALTSHEAQCARYVWRWRTEPARLRGMIDSGEFSK
jgi:hypothetical protein